MLQDYTFVDAQTLQRTISIEADSVGQCLKSLGQIISTYFPDTEHTDWLPTDDASSKVACIYQHWHILKARMTE